MRGAEFVHFEAFCDLCRRAVLHKECVETTSDTLLKVAALCVIVATVATGCMTRAPAPVVDRTPHSMQAPAAKPPLASKPAPRPADTRPEFYTVKRGDTIYSIALDHGVDYRELALWNGISNPGSIHVGQQLRMTPPQTATITAPFKTAPGVEARPITGAPGPATVTPDQATAAPEGIKTEPRGVRVPYSDQAYAQLASIRPAPAQVRPEVTVGAPPPDGDDIQFAWPATGKVVNSFSDAANLKGIGIAGKAGQPVYASAPGKVIFSGTGIRGFGKLIVIKHNNTFLSVYGHNSELLVKEGQNVAKGQKIAEMGNTDSDQVKLHFEIRRFGKPVDPVKLLPPGEDR
jgi:lipoprotein NlpD